MKTKILVTILLVVFLAACTPATTSVPTEIPTSTLMPVLPTATTLPTYTATATFTPIPPTATNTPTSTPKPTRTPIPNVFITLSSPFAADCGDGIPRIWVNDSFNASGDHSFDHHGHVDIFPPIGCDPGNVEGEVLAPISGTIIYLREEIYDLVIPEHVYPEGILEALKFSGVENPRLSLISNIRINFGHVHLQTGTVEKGQPIGDLVELPAYISHRYKIAYQIQFDYGSASYMFSPTLFGQDVKWECVSNSPYDCEAEPNDYEK